MFEQLTNDELEFIECFYNPKCLQECLFTEIPQDWNNLEKECIKIRNYQIPFLVYDSCIEDDDKLNSQENFKNRINAGTLFLICGRKLGKSYIGLVRNIITKLLYYSGYEMTMSAYDEIHVNRVLDPVSDYFYSHGLFRQYKRRIKGSPDYLIETKNGNKLCGVNETVSGKNIGKAWYGKHTAFNFTDEIQCETEEAYLKKVDAVSELGVVEILAGISLTTKTSPLGRVLKDKSKKNNLVKVPQYISPFWNEETKKERILQYGGESDPLYQVNVLAEWLEGKGSGIDMERVRLNCFNYKKSITRFEVDKNSYSFYQNNLIVERPINCNRLFICADAGEGGGTEITIFSEVKPTVGEKSKFHYIYNITLYSLSDDEQKVLFKWLVNKLSAEVISIDCTDQLGRAIYRFLDKEFGKERMVWCGFNEKIPVEVDTDELGHALRDKEGNLIYKEEYQINWSVKNLKDLFYEGRVDLPIDHRLEEQLSAVQIVPRGNSTTYVCVAKEDHLYQSFQTFGLAYWNTEFINIKPIERPKLSIGVFGL